VVGRAGDFFGPGADGALVNEAAVRGLTEGKRPLVLGDPDSPHGFSYIPDVTRALAALGGAGDDVDGQIFHLPVHQIAPAELYRRLGDELGVAVRPRRIGKAMFRLLSPFASIAREMLETFYQWDRPFPVDDSKFRARFPEVGAPLAEAIAGTAALALAPAARATPDGAPRPA
jgi:nucleoside-diphosphate-sugar epimerase